VTMISTMAMTVMAAMVMEVAVGAVMALLAAERIAEAALELEWGRGAMLAYAKEMARSEAG
jgi:hypothetical protein